MTARTITLKDGRRVEVDLYTDGWSWIAKSVFHPAIYATAPTEADAIAALKRKLEEQQ